MIQRCEDSLRLLSIPVPLGKAAVYNVVGLKNLWVRDRVQAYPKNPTHLRAFPASSDAYPEQRDAYGWIP